MLALALTAPAAYAQFLVPWDRSPGVIIVARGDDPRIALVEQAVAFWNDTLAQLGSGFRLGKVTRIDERIPESELEWMSSMVVGSGGKRAETPLALRGLPGDLTVYLAHSAFISFAGPFDAERRRLIAIRSLGFPLNLPNVARNVIAHEMGHAIGLGHNADYRLLMCGRPAKCRPTEFQSDEPRIFGLAPAEKELLLRMYPPDWKPRQ
jgi:hypothetical protein